MWAVAFTAAWEAVFGISYLRTGSKLAFPIWSMFDAGVYNMLNTTAWSVALGLVTLDCVKGLGGPVGLLYILFGINLRLVDREATQ